MFMHWAIGAELLAPLLPAQLPNPLQPANTAGQIISRPGVTPAWIESFTFDTTSPTKPVDAQIEQVLKQFITDGRGAAGVIGEAMVAIVLAQAFLEKFGGDSLDETRRNFEGYLEQVKNF